MDKKQMMKKAEVCFIEYVTGKGLKGKTIVRKKTELKRFLGYVGKELAKDLRDISSNDIEEYFLWMQEAGFTNSTLGIAHSMLVDLFMALTRCELVMSNPMDLTEIVIRERTGTKVILSEKEMEALLNNIETVTGYGLRDKSIFELMYVTGMRIGEIIRLNVGDVDFSLNELMIRQSKGRKDRIVPLGKVAKLYLKKWIKITRAYFLKDVLEDSGALFLSEKGSRISGSLIRYRLKHYLKLAGIEKKGVSPHSIRHSAATHLLQNGADIIFVAELLGHESLVTTQVYTSQIVEGLKKTHKMYHPRENQLYKENI